MGSSAGVFVPYGKEVSFAQVTNLVKRVHKDNVCIGYRVAHKTEHSDMPIIKNVLCPGLRAKWTFQEGDTLLIVARQRPDPTDATFPTAPAMAPAPLTELVQQASPMPGCIQGPDRFALVMP